MPDMMQPGGAPAPAPSPAPEAPAFPNQEVMQPPMEGGAPAMPAAPDKGMLLRFKGQIDGLKRTKANIEKKKSMTEAQLEAARKEILGKFFEDLKTLGVDPTDPASVKAFTDYIEQTDPDLAELLTFFLDQLSPEGPSMDTQDPEDVVPEPEFGRAPGGVLPEPEESVGPESSVGPAPEVPEMPSAPEAPEPPAGPEMGQ